MTGKRTLADGKFPMGRISFLLALMAVFALVSTPIWAQSMGDVKLLTQREYQRLNKQVQETYDKAVKALDKVDPVTAIALFDQASRLSLEAIELHFLTARIAHMRARITYRDESAKYYDIAEKALERVGNQKELSPLTKLRYETQKKQVSEEKKKLEVRDARRKAFGDAFRKLYAQEAYTEGEEVTVSGIGGSRPAARSGEGESRRGGGAGGGSGALSSGGSSGGRSEASSRRGEGDRGRRERRGEERPRRGGGERDRS